MSGRFAAAGLLVAACAGDDFDIAPPPPVVVGQTVQLATTNGATATWTSADPATASITATGELQGVHPGGTIVTATAGGSDATAFVTIDDGGVVSAAGGRITALSGIVTLDVPPGAVTGPTPITITFAGSPPLDPRVVGGTEVAIEMPAPFATPASLTIAYDASRGPIGLPPGNFHIAIRSDDSWTDLASTDDAVAHATTPITDTGAFAVRQAPATAPCTAAEARQFDFWLGRWDVRFGPSAVAHSEITRDPQGCTIDEHFTSPNTVGRSVNFYEPTTGRWYQTYVENRGTRLLLEGRLVAGEMILATPPGGSHISRITWSQAPDHVRQLGETSTNGGSSWSTDFDAFYTPSP